MAVYYVRPDGNNANTGLADTAAGAWATVKYALQFATNGVVLNGDTINVVADQGAYTENAITIDRALIVKGLRGVATVDGTGGGAGSDIITHGVNASFFNFLVKNAVDKGYAWTGSIALFRLCGATGCGGAGFYRTHGSYATRYCYARANGIGFQEDSAGLTHDYFMCEAGDNTSHNFMGGDANTNCNNCLSYDSGGDALNLLTAPGINSTICNNTFDGCVDGLDTAGTPSAGSLFLNNNISNMSGVGAKAVGLGTQVSNYNNFYGNGTDRTNWPTGANDTASDPLFVSASTDDYTPGSGSPLIQTGYTPFKSPNKLNMGAVVQNPGGGGSSTNATFVS